MGENYDEFYQLSSIKEILFLYVLHRLLRFDTSETHLLNLFIHFDVSVDIVIGFDYWWFYQPSFMHVFYVFLGRKHQQSQQVFARYSSFAYLQTRTHPLFLFEFSSLFQIHDIHLAVLLNLIPLLACLFQEQISSENVIQHEKFYYVFAKTFSYL